MIRKCLVRRALSSVVLGLILILPLGCASSKGPNTEAELAASGFKVVPAATPEQLVQLQTLPKGKVSKIQRNGERLYVYPDSTQKVLFVGRQPQYDAYRQRLEIEANAAADNAAARQSLDESRMNAEGQYDAAFGAWDGLWMQ